MVGLDTFTAMTSTSGTIKLSFRGIRDLILSENVCRRNARESGGSLLSTKSRDKRPKRGQGSQCCR